MRQFKIKIVCTILLGVMIFSIITPLLFLPKEGKAIPVEPMIEPPPKIAKETIWNILSKMAAVAWKNALSMLLGKVAQDAATYLGTFGKAGKPLFFTDKTYWTKMADSVVGDFLDEVAQKGFGATSLCDPIYPELKFQMLLFVSPAEKPFEAEARCSLSDRWKRMSDLSAFKLENIWQGVKIEEGKAPVMNLKQRINVDIFLNEGTKENLTSVLEWVLEGQNKVASLADRVKASLGKEFDKTPFEKETAGLKGTIEVQKDVLSPYLLDLKDCPKKNQNDFCNTIVCLDSLICTGITTSQCLGSEDVYLNCQAKISRSIAYAKQINEMVGILEQALTTVDKALTLDQPPDVDILQDIQKKFTPEGSDLGAVMELKAQGGAKAAQEVAEGKWLQGLQGEIQGITSKISGIVITPGRIIGDWASQKLVGDPAKSPFAQTGVAIADAINIFTTTLLNTLMKTIFEKGIAPPQLTGGKLGIESDYGVETIESLHADLADLPLIRAEEDFEILSQYASCPDKKYALPTQCVIDAGFARAIEENLTIKEAIEKNFLRGDWLIGADGEKDLMKIKKLRKARIVPLGLEIAAEKIIKGEISRSTLAQIVDGFDKVSSDGDCTIYVQNNARVDLMEKNCTGVVGSWVNDCCRRDSDGDLDIDINDQCLTSASPFCHLVDPNWVLKVPKAKCEIYASSAIPLANSTERQETCTQWEDCVGEDEDGNCHTYGYCTREKNIWRFEGTECPSYYNTCQVYTRTKDNQKFSWLKNTLDFGNCDANSVGCQWYCQDWEPQLGSTAETTVGNWACLEPGKNLKICDQSGGCSCTRGGQTCTVTYRKNSCETLSAGICRLEKENTPLNPFQNTIFFNKLVETCPVTSEGCTEFIRTKENLGTNLLPNSGFEEYVGEPDVNGILPDDAVKGWQIGNGGADGNFLVDGTYGTQIIREAKSGKVSVKFTAQNGGSLTFNQNFLSLLPDISFLPETKYTISFWVKNTNTAANGDRDITFTINGTLSRTRPITKNTPWQRVSFDFTTLDDFNKKITDIKISSSGDNIYLDDLQLEVGNLSSYKSYATTNKTYLKKPPDWFNCRPKCTVANGQTSCSYDGEICNLGLPSGQTCTSDAGCPCPTIDPECFDYTLACNQDEVGCEKYTPITGDLAVPAVAKEDDKCPRECAGYEFFRAQATSFYTTETAYFIPRTARTCPASEAGCEEFTNLDEVKRGGEGKEYYSYIRACQKPRTECQYFYTWVGSDTTGYQLKRYYLLANTTNNTPDEMLKYDSAVPTDPTAKKLWGQCEGANDARTNPNCKEFYNAAGEVSYKLYKNTITCSETCVPLRKTTPVGSDYCLTKTRGGTGSTLDGVEFTGDETTPGICTYMAIPAEGERCSAVNVGCRDYRGNAASNLRIVFFDDFENLSVEPWTGGTLSSESIYFGGRSMKVKTDEATGEVLASRPVQDLVQKGKSYLLSFLAKRVTNQGTNFTAIRFVDTNVAPLYFNLPTGTHLPDSEWRTFTLGPVYFDREVKLDDPSTGVYDGEKLYFTADGEFYIDNIILKEVQQSVFAIKNSWTTPEICDKDLQGNSSPQLHLGCQEYRDRANLNYFFKSFSQLCSDLKIGCEALIDTKNSFSPFKEEFNIDLPENDEVTVLPDKLDYWVNDPAKSCPIADKGCQKFGLPTLSQGEPISWTDFYFKNNPDLYTRRPTLCQYHQQNCEEFQQAGAGKAYFKDPADKICVWREKVPIGGEYKTGWFKKGTDQACYDNYLPDGVTYGIRLSSEFQPPYLGFAGECEERFAGCNEYIEPTATGQNSYYYLDNDKLDKSSCGGQVSLKEGCVLFQDQNNPEAIYNSIATYAKSEAQQSRPVSPINCKNKPWADNCTNAAGNPCSCEDDEYINTDYCQYCYVLGQTTNDTNLILKVRRDRVCGEWLYCSGKRYVWQETQQKFLEICDHYLRCQKQTGKGEGAECTAISEEPTVEPLTEENYKKRDVSWSGMDYSGYSLYNFYPIEKLRAKNYSTGYALSYYIDDTTDYGVSRTTCTGNENCPTGQICSGSYCVVSPTCKIYPESSSPFSKEVSTYYSRVNFCTERGGTNCVCSYRKTESTLGETTYFNLETDVESIRVCSQAEHPQDLGKCCSPPCPAGMPAATREDCTRTEEGRKNNLGKCEPMKKITDYIGVAGYCLEPDLEKPRETQSCLTWFPGEAFTGLDPYNQVRSAGYFPASDRRWYGYQKHTVSYGDSSFASPLFPLGFNLVSGSPVSRQGGSWGCAPNHLVTELYHSINNEFSNNNSFSVRYGHCFYSNERWVSGYYFPYLDKKYKKTEISFIEVNVKISEKGTGTGESCEKLLSDTARYCEKTLIINGNPSQEWWKDVYHYQDANDGNDCVNTGGKYAVMQIAAEFDADDVFRNLKVNFYDSDGGGRGIILDMKLKLSGGTIIPFKAYLAPNRATGYYPYTAACLGSTSNYNNAGCQDYLGLYKKELYDSQATGHDGDKYLRNYECFAGGNDEGAKCQTASCFIGDQRTEGPTEAIYSYSSRYVGWNGYNSNPSFLEQKIYEYMIERIEIDWSIDKSDPSDCDFGSGDCSGLLTFPFLNPEIQEKEYRGEVTCAGAKPNPARLFIQAIFDQKDGELKGFKTEFNDDGDNYGGAKINTVRIILKEGAKNLVKIVDKPYLPTVVNTNLIKLKPDGTSPYGNMAGVLDYGYECLPRGATGFQGAVPKKYIVDSEGNICFLYSGGIYGSGSDLQKLFPKIYSPYSLNSNTLSYYSGGFTAWDVRNTLHPADKSPKVKSVRFVGGVAQGGDEGKITIGGQDSGNINVAGKSYTANLKFYAWADGNYMPVREVIIDWGDGFQSGSSGMIAKNRKDKCKSVAEGGDFSDDPDACLNQYWEFVHTYVCPAGCSYTPKVYVKDNWGWCAGGYYKGDATCLDPNQGVPYDGLIIISP